MLGPMLYFQFAYVADQATRGADGELRLLDRSTPPSAAGSTSPCWLLQLVGTARLFRRIGVPLASTLSPLIYLLGLRRRQPAARASTAGVGAMAGANLQDHAVYDPAQRILVTLFPERLRPAATTLIDGPVQRAGGALGNVLVLALIGLGAPAWVPARRRADRRRLVRRRDDAVAHLSQSAARSRQRAAVPASR